MAGARTALLFASMTVAVAVWPWNPQPPLPIDLVRLDSGLYVMHYEVTFGDWKKCVSEKACSHLPKIRPAAAGGEFPITDVNWFDVNEYLVWARIRTGLALRLPTLAEWHQMSEITLKPKKLLFTDPRLAWAADYGNEKGIDPTVRSSGGFSETSHSIADVSGNVWEWTSTCASPGLTGQDAERCPAYQVAGEHDSAVSVFVRDPALGGCSSGRPPAHLGFRLVTEESPGR
jgi:formylglycine-generating enzyme required for sulfatase activity